jgi:hypothetical protein
LDDKRRFAWKAAVRPWPLRSTDHELGFRLVDRAHGNGDLALIPEDPTRRPTGSRLIATRDKADFRVRAVSERNASDETSARAIARGDRHRHWGFSLHHKWRLRHQDRAMDVPLLESRETRKALLLSGSEITATSVDAKAANPS